MQIIQSLLKLSLQGGCVQQMPLMMRFKVDPVDSIRCPHEAFPMMA